MLHWLGLHPFKYAFGNKQIVTYFLFLTADFAILFSRICFVSNISSVVQRYLVLERLLVRFVDLQPPDGTAPGNRFNIFLDQCVLEALVVWVELFLALLPQQAPVAVAFALGQFPDGRVGDAWDICIFLLFNDSRVAFGTFHLSCVLYLFVFTVTIIVLSAAIFDSDRLLLVLTAIFSSIKFHRVTAHLLFVTFNFLIQQLTIFFFNSEQALRTSLCMHQFVFGLHVVLNGLTGFFAVLIHIWW